MIPSLATTLFGAPLVPSDVHDDDRVLMTADRRWFFIPLHDCPVMSRPTIGYPEGKPTSRHKWAVAEGQYSGGGYWEPDDWDLVEVGQENSLWQAARRAKHLELDYELDNMGQADWETNLGDTPFEW